MGFETTRRYGRFWDDAKVLDELIRNNDFVTTGKNERDFEQQFSFALSARKDAFSCSVITQIHKSSSVKGVYCFGKKHRPDMTLDENGIAIELKHITYAGLKEAIGQGYLYRLKYKYVFLIFVISEDRRNIYDDLCNGKEPGLESLLQHLADHMNIFSYIVPAFRLKPAVKSCFSFFEPLNK